MLDRIASALHRELGATPRCHLFLYDPVKRLKATSGGSADYKQVHGNVERVRVIVMEDEGSSVAFPLMVVDGLPPQSYLRLPGTHGTATQCTGHPIGQLGLMLAMEWLMSGADSRVQMYVGRELSDAAFCREYARVNIVNPLANGMRLINDAGKRLTFDAAVTFKEHAAGARALDAVAGPNVFSGTGFFVNDDHARRFNKAYPGALATAAAMATGAPAAGVGRESLAQLRSYDRQGFDFFMRYMHVPYTNVRL